jgi:hypothetical protein
MALVSSCAKSLLDFEPHYVLPKPPSDNRLWRARSGLRKGAVSAIVHAVLQNRGDSSIRHTITEQTYTTNSLTPEARQYVNLVRQDLKCKLADPKKTRKGIAFAAPVREASDNEFIFLVYRPVFEDRRRDAGNAKKIIEDTLFDEDRYVHTWVLPMEIDKENPHVDVWIYRLPRTIFARGSLL